MKRPRRLALGGLSALVLGTIALLVLAAPHLPAWLDVGSLERPARWAFVLAGGVDDRPSAAAALYRAGLVQGILLSTPRPTPDVEEGVHLPEERISRELLLGLGIPEEDITTLPGEVDSTFDEAEELGRFLATRGDDVLIVTHDFHTRRARFIFRRVLGQDDRLQIVGCPSTFLHPEDWWTDEIAAVDYPKELLKILYYRIRY